MREEDLSLQKNSKGFQKESSLHSLIRGKYAEWLLGVLSLLESWFLPILIEPFMVLPILARPKRWFRIATIATLFSMFGGILGYLTGMFFFEIIGARLIELYGVGSYVEKTTEAFNSNVFWVIFAGAFTPLPYKVFTLVGGFLHVNFFLFIIATLVGRGLRFYAVGLVLGVFGPQALALFRRHIAVASSITAIGVVAYLIYAYMNGL